MFGLDFVNDVSLKAEDTDEYVAWIDTDGGGTCAEDSALVNDDCEYKCLLYLSLCWKQSCLIPFKESIFVLCLHRLLFGSVIFFFAAPTSILDKYIFPLLHTLH